MARRKIDHANAKRVAVSAVRRGLGLGDAALAADVHVATLRRWKVADEWFHDQLRRAAEEAAVHLLRGFDDRPLVPWRNRCPECLAKVVVRTAKGGARFWRCGRWPHCSWASWRPRHPRNCRACGGPRFWSHSRKSIACDHCGMRRTSP